MRHFEQSQALQRLPEQFFAGLVKKVQHLLKEGHDVINLGQGNPDLPTPQPIIDTLQQAAEKPGNHKYSPFRGRAELKQAAADFYNREYDVELDPDTEVAILLAPKRDSLKSVNAFSMQEIQHFYQTRDIQITYQEQHWPTRM